MLTSFVAWCRSHLLLRPRAVRHLASWRGMRVRVAGTMGIALTGGALPLGAQAPIIVLPLRTLDFNIVLPGIPKTVDAVDPRGGVLELRGDPTRQVRITLSLPTVILTTGGVFLPVVYGTSDGVLSTTFDPSAGTRFDPNAVRTACFNPSTGSLFLFLGGRVLPRPSQRRGEYGGTVIATVTYTGASC